MAQITIIKRYEREFRLPFYKQLEQQLPDQGMKFQLIIGQANKYEQINIQDLLLSNPFGPVIPNRYFYLGRHFLSFQNAIKNVRGSNLVIVQQSNSELLNYLLLLRRKMKKTFKIAFWGHGVNFQAYKRESLTQKFKLFLSTHVDHWFAYTQATSDIVSAAGFPLERITVLNNTIDTLEGEKILRSITQDDITRLRAEYSIKSDHKVGIFCGSLYKLKGIEFLLRAVDDVRQRAPNLQFFVLGDGEMKEVVTRFEASHSDWFHYVGFKSGRDKLQYFSLADFQLIPGAIGLNIIDSFFTRTPLVTVKAPFHGPEIAYLENWQNGVISGYSIEEYSSAILGLIRDPDLLHRLQEGCEASSKKYTIENMAHNFSAGILKALE